MDHIAEINHGLRAHGYPHHAEANGAEMRLYEGAEFVASLPISASLYDVVSVLRGSVVRSPSVVIVDNSACPSSSGGLGHVMAEGAASGVGFGVGSSIGRAIFGGLFGGNSAPVIVEEVTIFDDFGDCD